MGFYSDDFLRTIRNQVDICRVIYELRIETRTSNDLVRFRCPVCYGFHTATNPKTNLGRCFDCKKNYNPIDLVMTVSRCNFLESVDFLKKYIKSTARVIDDGQND